MDVFCSVDVCNLFNCMPFDRHWGCFHFFGIIKNAAVNLFPVCIFVNSVINCWKLLQNRPLQRIPFLDGSHCRKQTNASHCVGVREEGRPRGRPFVLFSGPWGLWGRLLSCKEPSWNTVSRVEKVYRNGEMLVRVTE